MCEARGGGAAGRGSRGGLGEARWRGEARRDRARGGVLLLTQRAVARAITHEGKWDAGGKEAGHHRVVGTLTLALLPNVGASLQWEVQGWWRCGETTGGTHAQQCSARKG